jgi:hypothetical protein
MTLACRLLPGCESKEAIEQFIKTSDGLMQGFHDEGIFKFYGIPYAMPPVGELR